MRTQDQPRLVVREVSELATITKWIRLNRNRAGSGPVPVVKVGGENRPVLLNSQTGPLPS